MSRAISGQVADSRDEEVRTRDKGEDSRDGKVKSRNKERTRATGSAGRAIRRELARWGVQVAQ